MNSWLRNIQGQLTELATEVLQEATEEVEDPETELQVERRKCAEAERMLIIEKSKSDQLEKRIAELKDQLYKASLENDASREKFENMIATRDIQIEHLQQAIQSNRLPSNRSFSSFQNIDLEERAAASEKCSVDAVLSAENRKIAQELAELKEKHEAEISALMTVNMENINHICDEYEQKIRELQNWGIADVSIQDDEKAIAHEKEINELKSALELVHEENQRTIAELKAQLLEKERELHKIHETGFTTTVDTVFDVDKHEDSEKRPSSVDGTDSAGSNNGWERMGNEYNTLTEFKSPEDRVASTSADSHNQLKQSLEEANLQIAQLSEQCASLTAKLDSFVSERQDMEQQLIEAHEEKHQLIKQLNESAERCAALEKEVSSLRCSADILKQEKTKVEELYAEKEQLARLLSDARTINESTSEKLEHLTSELIDKDRNVEALNEELKKSRDELFKSQQESEHFKEGLIKQLNESADRCAALEKEVSFLRSSSANVLKQDETKIEELFAEKEELARLLSDARMINESTDQRLEHLTLELSSKDEKLDALNDELKKSRDELFKSREELEHLKKELERLREHLISMEDISTREAIIAEERETQLRNEIRSLQERSSHISENVSQSHNQYQCEISTLRDQLVASEENSATLRALLEEREKSLAEVSKALANLQQVLGELGEDQKQEIAAFEKQMEELKKENEVLRKGLGELQRRESQLVEDRRYFEDSLTLLKEQDARKNQVIEDLENHIEELTAAQQRKDSLASRGGDGGNEAVAITDSGGRPMSTYKIDDVTLKQLFYSYLIADKEKQPEIALVMASILGYSQEEHSSIQEAVSRNSGGWFGFGGGRRALFGSGAPSLTDQFIRFLEAESRSLNEQPKLHIPSDHPSLGEHHSGLSTDITPLSTTETISSSDAMTARSAYSTSDLQSILES